MEHEPDQGLTRIPDENDLVLKMKQGSREKDSADRGFLQKLIKSRRAEG